MEINDDYEVCIEFLKSSGTAKRKPVITEMMKISSNGMDVRQQYMKYLYVSSACIGEYFAAITSVIREDGLYTPLLLHLSRSTLQVLEEVPLRLAVHTVSQIKNSKG